MTEVTYTNDIPLTENEMLEALDIDLVKRNARYHWQLSYPGEKRRDRRTVSSDNWLTREQLIEEFPFVAPLLEGSRFGFLLHLNRDGEWLRISQAQSARKSESDEFIPIREVGGGRNE